MARKGIYKICGPHGVYVGSSVNVPQRWVQHRKHLVKGVHHSIFLQRAWSKYGPDSFTFEFLEDVSDSSLLIVREQWWMDTLLSQGVTLYNTSPIAKNCLGVKHSQESKEKMAAAKRGRKLSPEQKASMAQKKKEAWDALSPEEQEARNQKRKSSLQAMWATRKEEILSKRSRPTPIWTEEMREEARQRRLGTKHSEEAKQKISAANAIRFSKDTK